MKIDTEVNTYKNLHPNIYYYTQKEKLSLWTNIDLKSDWFRLVNRPARDMSHSQVTGQKFWVNVSRPQSTCLAPALNR